MWNPFKKKEPPVVETVEQPKTYEIAADIKLGKPVTSGWMRQGMWVVVDGRVAILHKIDSVGLEVHYVSMENGETILIDHVPVGAIRQARYTEIPECRRVNFPIDVARGYGYGD